MDRYDANYDDKRITPGRVGLEHTAEEEMQLVSLTIQPLLPSIQGSHGHYQLRDCFAISSVDPNFAYATCIPQSAILQMRCINLTTGEFRTVGKLWSLVPYSIHCICTGFGYIGLVTSHRILIAEESDWTCFWSRESLTSDMLNSCVFSKITNSAGEEEIVLITGSNGGCISIIPVPKPQPKQYELVDIPQGAEDIQEQNGVDQTDVPPGKRRVRVPGPRSELEIKQCLIRMGPTTSFPRLPNINCVVQGKGMYTDFLIAAPDYERRLVVLIRSPVDEEVGFLISPRAADPTHDAKWSIFEVIEEQRKQDSLLLPLPMIKQQSIASSLTLAWAPWYHRSLVAAGTEHGLLAIYDFDKAYELLLANHGPDTIFTLEQSKQTVLFTSDLKSPARLLKFSPLPSVPILAIADSSEILTFLDCRDWSIERVRVSGAISGMIWTLDASRVIVATERGIETVTVKLIPSMIDKLLVQLVQQNTQSEDIADDDLRERFNLLNFGQKRGQQSVDWLDEKICNPAVIMELGIPGNPHIRVGYPSHRLHVVGDTIATITFSSSRGSNNEQGA